MTELSDRIRQAREYIGFTVTDAARYLSWSPVLIAGIEDGTVTPDAGRLARLGNLYRRPAGWFTGEWEHRPDPGMVRQLNENPRLTDGDREAVLDFAEFLAGAGPAPKPRRDRG